MHNYDYNISITHERLGNSFVEAIQFNEILTIII